MIDQILIIAGVTFLVLITPGPDMVLVVRNTMVDGRSAGYKTALGILAGNLVHITYCVVGIGWLISKSVVAFSILKYAGAAYLVYLGISSLRQADKDLSATPVEMHQQARRWFAQGFMNNILNPKGTLFFLGVFTAVITPDTSVQATVVLVAIMILMCALFWVALVQTLESPGVRRTLVRSGKFLQQIFGVVLISLGLRVALITR
ncbi:MAG: LysE family translocator [Woeseiaceae bacterium]